MQTNKLKLLFCNQAAIPQLNIATHIEFQNKFQHSKSLQLKSKLLIFSLRGEQHDPKQIKTTFKTLLRKMSLPSPSPYNVRRGV
jgi:hypothetical protein